MIKLFLGTGTFYKLGMSLEEQKSFISNADFTKYINGLEICIAKEKEMDEIDSNKEYLKFLQSFEYNILHAPFKKFFVTKKNYKAIFEKIILFAKMIKAKHVVWHLYNVESVELLSRFEYPYTIENTLTGCWNGTKIIEVFNKNNLLKMTLDTSHAYHFGKEEFTLLTAKLEKNITHIHLSNIIDEIHHVQFHQRKGIPLKEILDKLPRKKELLITMEENFDNTKDMSEEIKYVYEEVKKWLETE